MDVGNLVAPSLFNGGSPQDYVVQIGKAGGLGTRHLLTNKYVPHVVARTGASALKTALGSPVGPLAPIMSGANLMTNMKTLATAQKALSTAQTALTVSSVGLGVGVLTLGVAAWGAWNIHQTRKTVERTEKKIDHLSKSVDYLHQKTDSIHAQTHRLEELLHVQTHHLAELIEYNGAMLGAILDNQGHLAEGIQLLRKQIADGFDNVVRKLDHQDAVREARDLKTRMNTVHEYHRICSACMARNQMPDHDDLKELKNRALELQSWLTTRMDEYPVGSPERLPYTISRAYALRQEIDARTVLDATPFAKGSEVTNLQAIISDEIRALSQAKLFPLAIDHKEIIDHYIYLRRALGESTSTVVEFQDGTMMPFFSEKAVQWDDQLGPIRKLSSKRTDEDLKSYPITTLREHESWYKLTGQHLKADKVPTETFKSELGANHAITPEAFNSLLEFGKTDLDRVEDNFATELRYDW